MTGNTAGTTTCTCLHARQGVEVYFEGNKSFWKTRQTVDVAIICHTRFLCVEVLVFDPQSGLEANHLYLDSVQLAGKVDQQELQEKLSQKKEAFLRLKKPFDAAHITKDLLVQAMSTYILNRLQLVASNDNDQNGVLEVAFAGLSSNPTDAAREADILCEMPAGLLPTECHFAKKVKSSDIKHTLNLLKLESNALKSATKLAELSLSSVDNFKLMLAEKLRRDIELRATLSPARLNWIRAINCVLIQNFVEKVRGRLTELGHADWAKVGDPEPDPEPTREREREHHLPSLHKHAALKLDTSGLSSKSRTHTVKVSRRTLDNSLIDLKKSATESELHLPAVNAAGASTTTVSTLSHGTSSKRERSRLRRSMNGEMYQALSSAGSGYTCPSPAISARLADGPAPSLLQSFRQVSTRGGEIYQPNLALSRESFAR
jgi:hypothetical protein